MAVLNQVTLIGHLGNEPVLEHTLGGYRLARGIIKCLRQNRARDKKDDLKVYDTIPVLFWGFTAERIVKYCNAGAQLAITGHLRPVKMKVGMKHYVTTLEVSAETAQFVGPGITRKAVDAMQSGFPLANPANIEGDGDFVKMPTPLFDPADYAGKTLWEDYPQVTEEPTKYVLAARARTKMLESPAHEDETQRLFNAPPPNDEEETAKEMPTEDELEDIMAALPEAPPTVPVPGSDAPMELNGDSPITIDRQDSPI